jgi:hypothetical protein
MQIQQHIPHKAQTSNSFFSTKKKTEGSTRQTMQEKNLEYKNLVYCYAWIQIKEEEKEDCKD